MSDLFHDKNKTKNKSFLHVHAIIFVMLFVRLCFEDKKSKIISGRQVSLREYSREVAPMYPLQTNYFIVVSALKEIAPPLLVNIKQEHTTHQLYQLYSEIRTRQKEYIHLIFFFLSFPLNLHCYQDFPCSEESFLLTYSMAQQPLKSFDLPLMMVSLFDSILVTLIFFDERQSDG